MNILHSPTTTGGNSCGLSKAEKMLGISSDTMVFTSNWLNYPVDIDLHFEKLNRIQKEIKRNLFILKALFKYDTFNFNFAETLLSYSRFGLNNIDLVLWKITRKNIVFVFQGCDMRLKEYSKANYKYSACSECSVPLCTKESDDAKVKKYNKFRKYARKIYSLNPDLINYYKEAEFLPYASVDMDEWAPVKNRAKNSCINIVHAPTSRDIKGTAYIEEAVRKIKEKHDIKFIMVENIPHEKVKEIYKEADIAVDQLLAGWYGGFAVEMMALGKPVICYIRNEDLKFIPPGMKDDMPVLNTTKENIYDKLLLLVENEKSRRELGEKGREYVEKWHDPVKIVKRLVQEAYSK